MIHYKAKKAAKYRQDTRSHSSFSPEIDVTNIKISSSTGGFSQSPHGLYQLQVVLINGKGAFVVALRRFRIGRHEKKVALDIAGV